MDAFLRVRRGDEVHSFRLDQGLTIGRAADNDVVLEADDVSRHHGLFARKGDLFSYTDLGSANGSRIGGAEVSPRTPAPVRPGDSIRVGDFVLAVDRGDEPIGGLTIAGRQPFGTRLLGSAPNQIGPAGTLQLRLQPRIEVVAPSGTRNIPLDSAEISLGRDPSNTVVITDDVVSRRHLILQREGRDYRLTALSTTNGVRIRGELVQSRLLQDGDVLEIAGEVTLRYHLASDDAAAGQPAARALTVDPRRPVLVGRGEDCDLRLDHPAVSLHHARVVARGGAWELTDLGSTNGTYVNSERLVPDTPRAIGASDIVFVGPVRLDIAPGGIAALDQSKDIGLIARGLNRRVSGGLNLLQDISFAIEPQEFVAVVGVSGAGKSTLLGAISGLRPASDGQVLLNGTSLYDHFEAFRSVLGYVPQDDILHKELPVARALEYTAELRLPDDTRGPERRSRVDDVVATLGLGERRETPIGALSGGQRKRVSIGAELITRPGLFFLDEATSGLDPGTESQLMKLLRGLADDGHTIVLITHATKNVMLCDQVLFLARGGHLAYFGPPDQALSYFGVDSFDGIYERLEFESSPQEWANRYRESPQFREFVADRVGAGAPAGQASGETKKRTSASRGSSAFRQLKVLSARYFDIIRRDRVNLSLLFLLAPVLALVDLVAWPGNVLNRRSGEGSTAMTMLFLSALIPFLVGSLSFVREIVKEAPIYARERAVALGIWPYLGSKMAIGLGFALYHAAALFLIKAALIDFPGAGVGDYAAFYITLTLNVVSGVMWALLISAIASREEQAMMIIIGVIVLQVVFSGGLVPLADLGPAGTVLSGISSTAWSFKALTAAVGLTTAGCSGDFTACNIAGVQGQPSPAERQLVFKGVNDQFGDIFGADVVVCWVAMVVLIVALAVILYFIQRRKDVV